MDLIGTEIKVNNRICHFLGWGINYDSDDEDGSYLGTCTVAIVLEDSGTVSLASVYDIIFPPLFD